MSCKIQINSKPGKHIKIRIIALKQVFVFRHLTTIRKAFKKFLSAGKRSLVEKSLYNNTVQREKYSIFETNFKKTDQLSHL